MDISIVIPALNEEGIVGKTVKSVPLAELKEKGLEAEIVVVDNASTDNTAQEATDAGARVVREEKRGYGNAYLMGFKESKGDIIVMGDADGTYPLNTIYEFVQPLLTGDYDMVMGSRLKGDIQKGAMPALHRYVGNPFLTWLLNALFKAGVSDAHCGMRAIRREALDKLKLQSSGMEFASEMIIEAAREKLKIAEILSPGRRFQAQFIRRWMETPEIHDALPTHTISPGTGSGSVATGRIPGDRSILTGTIQNALPYPGKSPGDNRIPDAPGMGTLWSLRRDLRG